MGSTFFGGGSVDLAPDLAVTEPSLSRLTERSLSRLTERAKWLSER